MNSSDIRDKSYFHQYDFKEEISKYHSRLFSIINSYTETAYSSFISQVSKETTGFNESHPSSNLNKTQAKDELVMTQMGTVNQSVEDNRNILTVFLHLLLLIETYDDILMSENNNSILHTYKLLLSLSHCKRIFSTEEIQNLLYKLMKLSQKRGDLYLSNKKEVDNLIALYPNNLLLQNKYNAVSPVSLLNAIDSTEKKVNELQLNSSNICSIVPFFLSQSNIKESIGDPSQLSFLFEKLKYESAIANAFLNQKIESSLSLYSAFSELNIKYLYLFKKIIDEFDKKATLLSNPLMKHLFFTIIFQSNSFTSYLLDNIQISSDYLFYANKDVYMPRYISIGNFLYQRIHFNRELFEKMHGNATLIFNGLAAPIQAFFTREGLEVRESNVIHSIYHSLLFSLMFNSEYSNIFNTLAIHVAIQDSTTMGLLYRYIKSERRIKSPYFNNKSFIMIDYDIIHQHSVKIMIENSRDYVLLTSLSTYFFSSPMIVFLYVSIKAWSVKRKLFYDNEFIDNEHRLFDDCVLLYFVGLYLIHSGLIPPYKSNHSSMGFNTEKMLFEKLNSASLEQIGELFVNFFYFIISFAQKVHVIHKEKKVFFVDIQSKQMTVKERDTSHFTPHRYHQDEYNVLVMKKFHSEIQGYHFFGWKYSQIMQLEKEAFRMLHYLLNEDMMKTVFGFVNKRNE